MSLASGEEVGLNKTGELNLNELQKKLHKELICPICLDLIKNTMTTMDCLHRFCSDCIINSLESNNKECPVCKKEIVAKRDLRPEPKFDILVSLIFPNRAEYKAYQNNVVEEAALNSSKSEPDSFDAVDEIELVLMAHPALTSINPRVNISSNTTRYIKAVDRTTIDHLRKYLAMRLNLDCLDVNTPDNVDSIESSIYIAPRSGQFILLNGNLTLQEVIDKHWKADKPLELYYAITKNS